MLDLYQADIADRVSSLKPVDDVEPATFANFFRGTGLSAMQMAAEGGRALSMAHAVYPILADKVTGGTTLTERYFKIVPSTGCSTSDLPPYGISTSPKA